MDTEMHKTNTSVMWSLFENWKMEQWYATAGGNLYNPTQ